MTPFFLDLAGDYLFFSVQCTDATGAKTDPSAISLIVYEEAGADSTFTSTGVTGSPFTPVKLNSKTGYYGIGIAKSVFTAGRVYHFLWEATISSVATAYPEIRFATNAASYKADVSTLEGRLTSARAGYLDLLNTNLDATVSSRLASASYSAPPSVANLALEASVQSLLDRVTAARAGYLDLLNTNLDATVSSRLDAADIAGVATSGDMQTLISRVTSARAGYWDNLSAGPVATSTQATTLLGRLTDTRAGYLDLINSRLDVAVSTRLATAGISALALEASLQTALSNIATLLDRVSAARALLLDNLSRLDVAVSTRLAATSYSAPPSIDGLALDSNVQTLLARLTETRAGYLDAAISSRLAAASYSAPPSIDGLAQDSDVQTLLSRLTDARAGYLDAAISSRLATTAYSAPPSISGLATLTQAAAIQERTDRLPDHPVDVADLVAYTVNIDPEDINIDLSGVASITQAAALLDRFTVTRAENLDYLDAPVSLALTGIANVTGDTETILIRLDGISNGMATTTQASDVLAWQTATRGANIDSMPAEFDALAASEAAILGVLGNGGGRPILISVVDAADGVTPIPFVTLTVRNASEALITQTQTDPNGTARFSLPDGQYVVWFFERAWAFDPQDLVVDGNTIIITYQGHRRDMLVDPPDSPDCCRVYTYLRELAAHEISAAADSAECKITELPFSSGGNYFTGMRIAPHYDTVTGMLWWDVVWDATIALKVPQHRITAAGVVPRQGSISIEEFKALSE